MNGYTLPSRALVSQNDAAIIEQPSIPRSRFTGSWTRKTAFDAGYLVPFLVDEILPGDHMSYNVTAYLRMNTPLFPLFDNQRVDTFFFFVPCRLVWDNWVKLMGEQTDPSSSIDYTVPYVETGIGGMNVGDLFDHMGIPVAGQVDAAGQILPNALPFRAYNLIYNTWFRDENLINSIPVPKDNGPDGYGYYELKRRAKSHDYFTSALPWPQKFTAPTLPLSGVAPITGIGLENGTIPQVGASYYETNLTHPTYAGATESGDYATNAIGIKMANNGLGQWFPAIYADLSAATGISINTLRQAWMVQSLLERDARGGTRYVELIRSQFGVTNPDFRLQRPEYIGGGQSPLSITPIAQTAPTTGVPLGALGAAGTAAGTHRASYAATEHGYVIGLINVRSELSYQQGLHKMWQRRTRYDFYVPALAGLGEQAILRSEIYARGDSNDLNVFGYQERWHEYRTRYSEVTGVMRSNAPGGSLDAWHLAQRFATPPVLGETFINDTPPMTRVLAAGSLANNQQYLGDIEITRVAVRPIPTYGTPVNLGRF